MPPRTADPIAISIHAPLAGCDRKPNSTLPYSLDFNPRTPCGVRLRAVQHREHGRAISIHAPLAGCDRRRDRNVGYRLYFNPRTPCGVRLMANELPNGPLPFQSTHPLRGATLKNLHLQKVIMISIHAPLAGCDGAIASPRVPSGIFQSTHPLRGATQDYDLTVGKFIDFNPRTPCGVRRELSIFASWSFVFQSTHPLRGATLVVADLAALVLLFQSTHPLRGATETI